MPLVFAKKRSQLEGASSYRFNARSLLGSVRKNVFFFDDNALLVSETRCRTWPPLLLDSIIFLRASRASSSTRASFCSPAILNPHEPEDAGLARSAVGGDGGALRDGRVVGDVGGRDLVAAVRARRRSGPVCGDARRRAARRAQAPPRPRQVVDGLLRQLLPLPQARGRLFADVCSAEEPGSPVRGRHRRRRRRHPLRPRRLMWPNLSRMMYRAASDDGRR
mmetsp:Transcript_12166/g.36671  ORF Transcript_12166/g.36671 Transcript_12166/m.36671 type:complete len:221 (-) Transcript_12166:1445-2107(-)